MKNLYKGLIIGAGLFFLTNLSSCTTLFATNQTKPNPSYVNQLPSISKGPTKPKLENLTENETKAYMLFEKLYQKNPTLAQELGKLPEFQDRIDTNETKALENIVNTYVNNPEIETTFKQMLTEGKPETRKYCTPLRLLFWIAEEKELKDHKESLLKEYDLFKLFSNVKKRIREMKNLDEVSDMLNSPDLIDLWERTYLFYEFYIGSHKPDKEVFQSRRANCQDTSEFTVYLLERSGYPAGMLWVKSEIPQGHVITYFKDKGKTFVMDNGKYCPSGISGPFESEWKVPYQIISILHKKD